MDLPGDSKNKQKSVTHETMMKSLQSQRRVLGRVIHNEKELKEIVDQIIVLGLRLDGQLNVIGRNGQRIRTIEEAIASGELKGEKGDKGDKGDTGATGAAGKQGKRGRKGKSGTAGVDGVDGIDGAAGATGARGAQGAQGVSGASGASGASGTDGVDGSDGAAGASGARGASGASGAQGASGASGARGASGASGAGGGRGPTGARGATGPAGQGPDKSQNPDFDWDIPGGGSPSGGTYEGTREDDLVDEKIDERILRIIGLDDTVGIDYATYRTLLREKMAEGRMGTTTMSNEEVEIITEEWKRVKGKVGRFRVRKGGDGEEGAPGATGGINSDSFFNKKPPGDAAGVTPDGEDGGGDDKSKWGIAGLVDSIRENVESIAEIVQMQSRLIINDIKRRSRNKEKDQRSKAEGKMEGGGKAIMGMAKKALAPVQSVLDMIVNFFTSILMGKLLIGLIDWFANPDNKGKIESLGRFIGDWWPTLLGAFVLFATPLGGVIKFVVGSLIKLTAFMLKKGIPAAMRAIAKNPWAAGALAVGGLAAFGVSKMMGGDKEEGGETQSMSGGGMVEDITIAGRDALDGKDGADGAPGKVQKLEGGGEVIPMTPGVPLYNEGGEITPSTGERVTGAEPDTQLIAAQPGEVMMSKDAVSQYGADTLLGMNAAAGGSNVPEMAENVQKMSGGGLVAGATPEQSDEPISVDLGEKNSETVDLTGGKDGASGADGLTPPPAVAAEAKEEKKGFWGSLGDGLKTAGNIAMNVADPFGIGRGLAKGAANLIGGAVSGAKDALLGDDDGPTVNVSANLVPSTLPILEERVAKLEFTSKPPEDVPEPPGTETDVEVLPPSMETTTGGGGSTQPDRGLPDFPVVYDSPQRKNNIELYGIVGVK